MPMGSRAQEKVRMCTKPLPRLLSRIFMIVVVLPNAFLLESQTVNAACLPGGTPGNQVDKLSFFADVARQLKNPSTPESAIDLAVQALIVWEPFENTAACWNPLATTLVYADPSCQSWRLPGSSAAVQEYPSRACGIKAIADTLNYTHRGRAYRAIRNMLAKRGFDEAALQQALRLWIGSEAYEK